MSDTAEPGSGAPMPPPLLVLLDHTWSEVVPEEEILALAEAMKADDEAATRTIEEFRAELEAGDDPEGVFGVWLAFALGLSGRDDAGEALLEAVGRPPVALPFPPPGLLLAAQSALIERGEWTLRRLASRFPLGAGNPTEKLASGQLMHLARAAAACADETLHRPIADEAVRLFSITKPTDFLALESSIALAAADPSRALEILPSRLSPEDEWEPLEKILRRIREEGSAASLLSQSWTSAAAAAAEYGLAALDDTERAEDEGEVSSDIRQELDAAKPWIEGFLLSEHRRKVPGGDEDVADDLDLLLFTLFAHHAPDLRFTGAADIAKFMTETLPREIASEAEDFGRFGVLLPAFFLHLADGGAFPFAADCALEAERRAPEMIRRAADPARWSADKARMMDVLRAGVDPADPRALARWMRDRGWDSGDDPGDALEGLPRVPPIVRETRFTEPGPYDPCPCGSGEKYKFCCKKKKA